MNNGLSLEFPVTVRRTGKSDVMGILEFLTATECRFRSLVPFAQDERIELRLSVVGGPRLDATGRVLSSTISGTRHYHDVALDAMPGKKADEFVAAIAELSARHSERRVLPEVPATKGLVRSSVRVGVHEDVRFTAGGTTGDATATNISTGGMLMACLAELPVGATVDLMFALGGGTPNAVKGRVVAFHAGTAGAHQYNVAFFGVDDAVRERISAYVASKATQPVR